MEWYATLNKPALNPPDWAFSPVWSVLYVMIVIAVVLYYRAPVKRHVRVTTALLSAHVVGNLSWTFLFFGFQSPGMALIDCLLLDVSLAVLVYWFWSASRWAAALLIPYLCWILFATYLNTGIWILNR